MTATHPIHSRPTEELLAAGVTREQVTALREISQVVLGDTDRVFDVLGLPESRGDAATMLGAFHAVRSKNPPMPGQQATYAEKIRSAIRTPSTAPAKQTREEPPVTQSTTTTKTCIKCDKTKPADTDHFGSDSRTSDGLGRTCSECKTSAAKAAKSGNKRQKRKTKSPQGPAEKKSPDRPSQPDPPLSNGWDAFTDPRLSDLRAFQDILESTVTAVDSVRLEEAAEALNLIGERFRRKGNNDG